MSCARCVGRHRLLTGLEGVVGRGVRQGLKERMRGEDEGGRTYKGSVVALRTVTPDVMCVVLVHGSWVVQGLAVVAVGMSRACACEG